jgi:hypothetical protein
MKKILLTVFVILALFFTQAGAAFACPANCSGGSTNCAKGQVLQGVEQAGSCNGSGVTGALGAAVNILSIIVGAAAILMIVVSGLKYITSGGDSNKITSAKNNLIYALIGVAVAALAQLLVHFVLFNANNVSQPPPPPKKASQPHHAS